MNLSAEEENVARHYDEIIFSAELVRLPELFPVEWTMTSRYIERAVPPGATVAEVGVGGGHYTQLLASRGCRIHLVDISQRLLDSVVAKLRAAGLGERILGVHRASGAHLEPLADGLLDAVLFLGPLYHLGRLEDRRRAVRAAARVLKKGGVILAAGINRLSYLRDLFRDTPEQVRPRREFHEQYLRTGNLDPIHAPPIGYAHMTSVADFRQLFAGEFEQLALVAVESFLSPWQAQFRNLPVEDQAAFLDLVEQTATWPEAFGIADHYLYIGRKP